LPSTTTRGSGTVVAVIDGGVDGTNPNLAANMVDLTTYPGLQSETGCGTWGYDATTSGSDHSQIVASDHATHIAGIMAACGTGGVEGIASNAKIVSVQASPMPASLIRGYNWLIEAKEAGLNVCAANQSIGMTMTRAVGAAYHALSDADIVLTCSSMNEGTDVDGMGTFYGPTTATNVLVVNALQSDAMAAPYSCYGQYSTCLFAPGSALLSTSTVAGSTFNAFTAAGNTRSGSTGTQALVYEGFEADSSSQVDGDIDGGLTFTRVTLDENGAPAGTSAEAAPETSSDQWFLGSGSLKVEQDGDASAALLSDPVDLSGKVASGTTLYVGLSALTDKGSSGLATVSFKLMDGTYSSPQKVCQAQYQCWRSTTSLSSVDLTQALPDDVDLEHFQMLVSIDFDGNTTDATAWLDCVGVGYGREAMVTATGTSMAAPTVAGAVAVVAAQYPSESAEEWSARIKGGTTKEDRLDDLCQTGGTLDVAKALEDPDPVPIAMSVSGRTATMSGWFFSEGDTILVNGTDVGHVSWSTDGEGRTVATFTLPADTTDGYNRFAVTTTSGNQGHAFLDVGTLERSSGYEDLTVPDETDYSDASGSSSLVATDGAIYLLQVSSAYTGATLQRYDIASDTWGDGVDVPAIPSGITSYVSYNLTAIGSKIYLMEQVMGFPTQSWLCTYDCESGTWAQSEVKGSDLSTLTLLSWDGKLCLASQHASTDTITIYEVDSSTGSLTALFDVPMETGVYTQTSITSLDDELVLFDSYSSSLMVYKNGTATSYSLPADVDKTLGQSCAIIPTKDGIMCVGLARRDGTVQTDTALLDTETGTWSWTGRLCSSQPLVNPISVMYDGKVYVMALTGDADGILVFRSTDVSTPEPDSPTTATSPDSPAATSVTSAVTQVGEDVTDDQQATPAAIPRTADTTLPWVPRALALAGVGLMGIALARRRPARTRGTRPR
ncbi:MAG: S8 family serine peptidase, partial [Atopobiaceae bacterium]|nr:S8 family serine peptidase [Atopobiaceae bacterium]